jgi:hypothetical protein
MITSGPATYKYVTMDIKDTIKSIKTIYMSDNALSMLCDFERVLDSVDIYTFPHWEMGELVEGPVITKYFVRCKFMWPKKMMPDPSGAKRLVPYGVRITYEETHVDMPIEITKSDDYRPGSKKGKIVKAPVFIVEIMMPKSLMKDIKQGSKEIAGEEIDLSDLSQAYEKDLDQKSLRSQSNQQPGLEPGQEIPAGNIPAPGVPA